MHSVSNHKLIGIVPTTSSLTEALANWDISQIEALTTDFGIVLYKFRSQPGLTVSLNLLCFGILPM